MQSYKKNYNFYEYLCYWPSCLWLSVQDRTDHLTNFLLFIPPARVQVYAQKYSRAASVASLRDIQLVENWTGLARTFYRLFTMLHKVPQHPSIVFCQNSSRGFRSFICPFFVQFLSSQFRIRFCFDSIPD